MARIKVDFEGLTSSAASLTSYIQSLESLNTRMSTLRENVMVGWEGEAADAFLDMMQKYGKEATKMLELMGKFRDYATDASTDFDDVDRRCAALIRNAF